MERVEYCIECGEPDAITLAFASMGQSDSLQGTYFDPTPHGCLVDTQVCRNFLDG